MLEVHSGPWRNAVTAAARGSKSPEGIQAEGGTGESRHRLPWAPPTLGRQEYAGRGSSCKFTPAGPRLFQHGQPAKLCSH